MTCGEQAVMLFKYFNCLHELRVATAAAACDERTKNCRDELRLIFIPPSVWKPLSYKKALVVPARSG